MQSDLNQVLETSPVVPLVQSNSPAEAVKISKALLDGGLKVLEVVLRTDEAFDCLAEIAKEFPDVQVGAGTVLSADHVKRALDCGAKFIVSPGFHPELKALSSVFRDVRFMPTGGVSAANLPEYLNVPAVLACGGSWLTPKDAIAAGDFAAVTKLAKDALSIAHAGSK